MVYSTFFAVGVFGLITFLATIFPATAEQLRLTTQALRQLRGAARPSQNILS